MSFPKVHIIGAGLAGLAAAVDLSKKSTRIEISEAAPQAGGRCRSFFDRTLDLMVDNGNHLVLAANSATRDYLDGVGGRLTALPSAVRFADLRTGDRWQVESAGGWLSWLFASSCRIPGATVTEYFRLAALLRRNAGRSVHDILRCEGVLWQRLIRPFLLAVLNTEPEASSAALAGSVIRETLMKGAAACRPLVARDGLSAAFIDPALAFLGRGGIDVRCNRRLRRIIFGASGSDRIVTTLDFGTDAVPISRDDSVILAVPPWVAQELVPELLTPDDFRPIVNGHFRIAPESETPAIIGVIGGTVEWIFAFPDRVSVTVSSADRLIEVDRERLAALLWADVAAVLRLPSAVPRWNIVVEKRATFAATPRQMSRRPGSRTQWANLFLAGDWVDTGLPATIEGAIRSGQRASALALQRAASIEREIGYAESPSRRIVHS